MAERQSHGFKFEQLCNNMLSNLTLFEGYTNIDDALYDTGRHTVRVSIKSINYNGEICLGDIFRIVDISEPLLMLVGNHFRGKAPDSIDAYYLPNGFPGIMNGKSGDVSDLCHRFYDYMLSEDNLNKRGYDKKWAEERRRFLDAYIGLFGEEDRNDQNIFIHPRPKRDHKHQRRIQCAIPRRYRSRLDDEYRIAAINLASNRVETRDGFSRAFNSDEEAWDAFSDAINRLA